MKINLEDLQSRKLMIATPRYGGQCTGVYADAFDNVRQVMTRYGLTMDRVRVDNDSCIARARNTLVEEFMRTDFTHLLFWDADIEATADDVFGLLNLADPNSDKDVVCGLYPKKHINWNKVAAAVHAGVETKDMPNFITDSVFNPIGLSGEHDLYAPMEVAECGTGFMMIQRHVVWKFMDEYPERTYVAEHNQRETAGLFLDEVVERRFLTEDYNFCRLIRAVGLKIWVAPWMNLNHFGNYKFVGNPEAVSALAPPLSRVA